MRFDDLDHTQRGVVDAVLQSHDKVLVVGGPGTGKTTTALWVARRYLETPDPHPGLRVLFLTFSRSAVSQIMREAPGVLSRYADRVEILTFHSLAYRLLKGFGRYAGLGTAPPSIEPAARSKLLGHDGSKLQYKDLIPQALSLLDESEHVRRLFADRWGLVICDEAQDTGTEQWQLLRTIALRKVLLLGDPNQMIYTFIGGVSPKRFQELRRWVDKEVELESRSYRDPSGVIPAVAEAIRRREFDHEAVLEAIRSGRLTIHFDVDSGNHLDMLKELVRDARAKGSRDVGIFAHSNAAVADLAEQLNDAEIEHVLVGIPEAHAEALGCMATQCAFSLGLATIEDVRESLAVFVTASTRQRDIPYVARALIGREDLPDLVETALQRLERDLGATTQGTMGDLIDTATRSWEGLAIAGGARPWRRAVEHFQRLTGPLRNASVSEDSVRQLLEIVERSRVEALTDLDYSDRGTVRLMNYHQTKGRQADTVVHVFRPDDYFGPEAAPYEGTSRLLHVAISRARSKVIILLPPMPHPAVRPFKNLRQYA